MNLGFDVDDQAQVQSSACSPTSLEVVDVHTTTSLEVADVRTMTSLEVDGCTRLVLDSDVGSANVDIVA